MRNRLSSTGLMLSMFGALAVAATTSVATIGDAKAQVIERGVQGGVVGALIGGLVGGGRGAGRGAAIGAGVGLVTGAAEANARARYDDSYYGPPPGVRGPGGPGGPGLVFGVQESLTRLGYDPGPVDGVYGYATAEAIREFQYDNRLPVDGRPSPRLLNFMISQGG